MGLLIWGQNGIKKITARAANRHKGQRWAQQ